MARIKRIEYDETATLVDHLGELRSRIIASVAAFGTALALCFWQNHMLLDLLQGPIGNRQLITLGVAEPFTTTLTVSAYAAIILALPVVLYQLYAFTIPALAPDQQRAARGLALLVPVLFIAGAAFAFLVVVPAALQFLLHFNASEFQTELRAKEYYTFVTGTTLAVGAVFQVPIGILALSRLGIVTPAKLRHVRRYAYLACAVVAAALPGVDPVSMLLETVPLIVLYELSIVLASAFGAKPDPIRPTEGATP
ncbi:MAG: sec-independent protein translocase protein TatC [Thermoleophilaceae bacterium]|nr:sec-independent protein translocase protein TatC [Thermoleophilaceae bacterium]